MPPLFFKSAFRMTFSVGFLKHGTFYMWAEKYFLPNNMIIVLFVANCKQDYLLLSFNNSLLLATLHIY